MKQSGKLPALMLALLASACASLPQNLPRPGTIYIEADAERNRIQRITGDAGVAGRPLRSDMPMRTASISKLVTALAVMRLSEQGKLDLDRDVGEYLGWPLRNPDYPDRPISLRMLLSHTSSLKDDAGYWLPLDGRLQSLLAKPGAWDSGNPPGTYFRYANIGSPVIAAIMEAATGKRFDRIMREQVFDRLQMDACFNWSGCSPALRAKAVTLLRPNGNLAKDPPLAAGEGECAFVRASDGSCDLARYRLGRNGSAFSPQGGLRMSAEQLVTIGRLLANDGMPLLSRKSFAEMTRPHWQYDGSNGDNDGSNIHAWGLGIELQPGGWVGHLGDAYGLRAGLWSRPDDGLVRLRIATMVDEKTPVSPCLARCP